MATTLQVGQSYHFTTAGSDGSSIPAGTLSASSDAPGSATVSVNPDNSGTVAAVGVGELVTITYSAPGYTSSLEEVVVVARPTIVVTDGPITG